MSRAKAQLVHPFLAIFISREIKAGGWTPDSLAWRWDELYGNEKRDEDANEHEENRPGQKRSVIDQWLRVYYRLSRENAHRLLRMLDLEEQWRDLSGKGEFLSEKAGVFNFYSRSLGIVEEVDLDGAVGRGNDLNSIAEQIVRIDADIFAHFGSEPSRAKIDRARDILSQHPDTWRIFLKASREIVAYWSYVSLDSDHFGKALRGDLPEHEINAESFRAVNQRDVLMYGPTVCVSNSVDGFDRRQLGAKVIGSFLYNLARMERQGTSFSEICTIVASDEGRRWVQDRFGLEPMPKRIGQRLAERAGWAFKNDGEEFLPAIYYGRFDDALWKLAGLR